MLFVRAQAKTRLEPGCRASYAAEKEVITARAIQFVTGAMERENGTMAYPVPIARAQDSIHNSYSTLVMNIIITCAYCKGTGNDFYYPSSVSGCRVCSKTGQVEVEEPAVTCAYCSGTGKNPLGVRGACPACRGKGSNTWKSDTVCTQCKGTGKSSDGYPCPLCKGKTKSNKGCGNSSSGYGYTLGY